MRGHDYAADVWDAGAEKGWLRGGMGECECLTCCVKLGRCVEVICLESFVRSVADPEIESRSPECQGQHDISKTILPLQTYFRSMRSAKGSCTFLPNQLFDVARWVLFDHGCIFKICDRSILHKS